jgi:mannose-6-phosphate isomerase-like protein (cupin superfamily)
MGETNVSSLILVNRHSGERLSLRRLPRGDEVWLELKGSLPPHREGPPMHIHVAEDEEGTIQSGTLSAVINGRQLTKGAGEAVLIPRGAVHRWWNAGDEPLSSMAMPSLWWIWTDIFKPCSRSSTRGRKGVLRSSTSPTRPCVTVTHRPWP